MKMYLELHVVLHYELLLVVISIPFQWPGQPFDRGHWSITIQEIFALMVGICCVHHPKAPTGLSYVRICANCSILFPLERISSMLNWWIRYCANLIVCYLIACLVSLLLLLTVLHTAVLPEACLVSSITRILWRFGWSSCVYWHGIQVLFTEVAQVSEYCYSQPKYVLHSQPSTDDVNMLQDDWDWSEKLSPCISTRRLGTKGPHASYSYSLEPSPSLRKKESARGTLALGCHFIPLFIFCRWLGGS